MKLEASLLRCEQQRDQLGDAVFHVRAESHVKIRQLRCTVQVRSLIVKVFYNIPYTSYISRVLCFAEGVQCRYAVLLEVNYESFLYTSFCVINTITACRDWLIGAYTCRY